MNGYESIIGKTIHWKVTRLYKLEWTLEHEGEIVASLKTNKILFTPNREGSFGNTNVKIEYNRSMDISVIIEKNTNKTIGRLDNVLSQAGMAKMLTKANFNYENLECYTIIRNNPGYAFQSQNGEVIAWANYNAHVTPTSSAFTLERADGRIDPWLIALICHYYAINQASPS